MKQIAVTAMDINNIGMTGIILAGFVMIYQRTGGRKWLATFAPYGRTALTNYVLQSVIGTFIFYGWGMGYLAELRNIYTFLMAFAIIGLHSAAETESQSFSSIETNGVSLSSDIAIFNLSRLESPWSLETKEQLVIYTSHWIKSLLNSTSSVTDFDSTNSRFSICTLTCNRMTSNA